MDKEETQILHRVASRKKENNKKKNHKSNIEIYPLWQLKEEYMHCVIYPFLNYKSTDAETEEQKEMSAIHKKLYSAPPHIFTTQLYQSQKFALDSLPAEFVACRPVYILSFCCAWGQPAFSCSQPAPLHLPTNIQKWTCVHTHTSMGKFISWETWGCKYSTCVCVYQSEC